MSRAGAVLRPLLGPHRRALLAGAAAGSVWMAAAAAVPVVVSRAVDDGIVGGDRGALFRWLAALAAVTAVQVLAGGARHWLACWLHYGTTAAVSSRVTARLHDARGGVRQPAGDLVSLVTSDAARVGMVADLCCRGTGAVVAIAGVAALMVATSPVLAGFVLAAIPVLLAVSAPLLGPLGRRSTAEQRARAAVASRTTDLVSGLRALHGLGAVPVARAGFAKRNDEARVAAIAAARIQAAWEAVAVAVPGALLAITVAVGHRLVADGSLTIGELVGFLALGQFLLTPVATLVEVGDVCTRGRASAARVAEVLHAPGAVTSPDVAAPAPVHVGTGPAVGLVDVVAGRGALDGCNFTIRWGEFVAIAASDARAAAAIAELLGRERDPDRGEVRVDDCDARRWSLHALRRTVLVADGDGLLVDGSLHANVAFGVAREDPAIDVIVDRAMRAAAVDDVLAGLPAGAASPVGERGRSLSGGQRQRIGLARALAADAAVLVLVDPTSAVDAHTEDAVARAVVRSRRRPGAATVVVTASPAFLHLADRVVHVHDGRAAADAPHGVLMATCETYRSMVAVAPLDEARA
jgi:putative ABC transport system ATP-binding protein